MRSVLLVTSTILFCTVATLANAADLDVRRQKEAVAPPSAPVVDVACLRWVETTYSWYNYCDPVPYYGRGKYAWSGGLF
jgi:hypothetical protein